MEDDPEADARLCFEEEAAVLTDPAAPADVDAAVEVDEAVNDVAKGVTSVVAVVVLAAGLDWDNVL